MSVNCGHIHTDANWEDTINTIKTFMEENGFSSVIPQEHIPELSGIDYRSVEEKNFRFFVITRSINGWTGIFEDGGQDAQKELAKYISQTLNAKTIWTIFSGSSCNYLYTVYENGAEADKLARGDAYDYDERGQLKYFEFYNEENLINFLKDKGITTTTVTYEEIMRSLNTLNLTKDDLIHIAFKRRVTIVREIDMDDEEQEEEKSGFLKGMMDRLTQPIWGKLEKEMEKILPQLQKAQEMSQLVKPLMEQGLKGDALRSHPSYQRVIQLEKEIMEEFKNSPYYSEEMEDMLKQNIGFSRKILKPFDPLEEEIKKLGSFASLSFSDLAESGKKIIELSSGLKIDWTERGLKRLDKALSWSEIIKKAETQEFKTAIGSLIGEILIKTMNGEWVRSDDIENSVVRIKNIDINPFKWYEEISTRKRVFSL